jgi:thiol:disulfide interchange protein DsbC
MLGKKLGILLVSSSVVLACPSLKEFDKNFHNLIPNKIFKVEKIEQSPIKGICQAIINLGGTKKIVVYTDENGRYLFLGYGGLVNIIDMKTKESLTQKTLREINKLSKNQVKELDKYVAFTYGKKGKVVYLFTDPECPFCQKLEPILKKLADKGKIQVKVILFPLPFHPHAKEKATAIVCHNIGWEGLQKEYWTEDKMKDMKNWQCEKGKDLIKKSIEIGKKYGINGTPTIITEDGKKIVGALPEKILKNALGIKEKQK